MKIKQLTQDLQTSYHPGRAFTITLSGVHRRTMETSPILILSGDMFGRVYSQRLKLKRIVSKP